MAADENQVHEKRELDASHDDPANWRGLFYYNKRDPRIFPPKRYGGGGYTTNFANPRSVAALIAIVVLSISLVEGLFYLFQGH